MKIRDYDKMNFDERQIQIRGKVYKHGFIAALLLLCINSILMDLDFMWASPFRQNWFMVVLLTSYVSVEFILRGVQFGKNDNRIAYAVVFGLLSLAMLILSVIHVAEGRTLIEDGMLLSIIACVLFMSVTVCVFIQIFREKKNTDTIDKN
ncbi:MAG: hypothetical protein FWE60_03520 [Oscillospiraceae bacterium]|nr:hypothetical protein [Oscillospiraceae bacterium]